MRAQTNFTSRAQLFGQKFPKMEGWHFELCEFSKCPVCLRARLAPKKDFEVFSCSAMGVRSKPSKIAILGNFGLRVFLSITVLHKYLVVNSSASLSSPYPRTRILIWKWSVSQREHLYCIGLLFTVNLRIMCIRIVVGILEPKIFQINLLVNHDIVGPGHSSEKEVNY